ncbi:MAG: hypothetical protein Q8K33_01585 [Cypionkella sp.]|uniref:hypothetical protein n=1 Tax=Cypionkella sp. TaxID=2811411 RepID=UPI002730DD8C|nr:hypothetical protein [Cypionkella sp.]MDP2047573.1 hypothetical protein [Cypionkella sp.]
MSNLEEHEAEQAAITAMCEAGTCDHPDCWGNLTPCERAEQIMDETAKMADEDVDYQSHRRAARSLLCWAPAYDDDTIETGAQDMLTDFLHLCDLAGWDFADLVDRARAHYEVEVHDMGTAKDEALCKLIERN